MNENKAVVYLRPILMGLISGTILISILFALFALIITHVNVPVPSISIVVALCGGTGGIVSGFISSKILKRKGLIMGLFSGILLCITIILISIIFSGSVFDGESITKYMVILVASTLGGILGVNSRKKRR